MLEYLSGQHNDNLKSKEKQLTLVWFREVVVQYKTNFRSVMLNLLYHKLLSENLNNCVVCILQKYIFYINQLNVNNYS